MCEEVTIVRNGVRTDYDSLGDLRAALPECVVILPGYDDPPDNNCLCPVDMEATAARAGMRATAPYTKPEHEWAWVFSDA